MLRLAITMAVLAACAGGRAATPAPAAAPAPARPPSADAACQAVVPAAWPVTDRQRRDLIARMATLRPACLGDAFFLAVYGALLLEDGDAEQAILWLERSLLLEPDNLGAQADFAIALAVAGDPGPVRALAAAWRLRADLPAALQARLAAAADPSSRYALPAVRLGVLAAARSRSAMQGEVSVLAGYESNFERSPRLSELTITVPGGTIVLPVEGRPRSGLAMLGNVSAQWAYAPSAQWIVRLGASASARVSRAHPQTDWRHRELAGSVHHGRGRWHAQLDASAGWVSGPLGEPFRQARVALAAGAAVGGCRLRAGGETDRREHRDSRALDARYHGGIVGLQCAVGASDWSLAMALRHGDDLPDDPDRPGGRQRIDGAGVQLRGTLGAGVRVEAGLRHTRMRDRSGYSELLDDGAIRHMRLRQLTLQAALPLPIEGLDLLLQWQAAIQRSNLALFGYRAEMGYAGLRYLW